MQEQMTSMVKTKSSVINTKQLEKFATSGKVLQQQYTTAKIEPASSGLNNSKRNFSGTIQKAPISSSSVIKTQRGGQHAYSRTSARGS